LLNKCWDRNILLAANTIMNWVANGMQETSSWTKALTWSTTFLHVPSATR